MNEDQIKKNAVNFIRKNKKLLIEKFANTDTYRPDINPVTVFMAGSPGAGKTEVSVSLVEEFKTPVVRIDADEIRALFEGYTGENAHLFQLAASIGVDELYSHCLREGLSVVVDGTFAHNKTIINIEKSIAKERKVVIYFVYQDPQVAWDFTKKREGVEHRRITKESFIKGYCMSRRNVNDAKTKFKERLELELMGTVTIFMIHLRHGTTSKG